MYHRYLSLGHSEPSALHHGGGTLELVAVVSVGAVNNHHGHAREVYTRFCISIMTVLSLCIANPHNFGVLTVELFAPSHQPSLLQRAASIDAEPAALPSRCMSLSPAVR